MPAASKIINEIWHFKQLKFFEFDRTAARAFELISLLLEQLLRGRDHVADLFSLAHECDFDAGRSYPVAELRQAELLRLPRGEVRAEYLRTRVRRGKVARPVANFTLDLVAHG